MTPAKNAPQPHLAVQAPPPAPRPTILSSQLAVPSPTRAGQTSFAHFAIYEPHRVLSRSFINRPSSDGLGWAWAWAWVQLWADSTLGRGEGETVATQPANATGLQVHVVTVTYMYTYVYISLCTWAEPKGSKDQVSLRDYHYEESWILNRFEAENKGTLYMICIPRQKSSSRLS